jgi:spore coat polysaccharide biosynthesis protein SpsF
MNRTLIAALACRSAGTRLYAKPLQNLEPDYCVLDHILECISHTPEIKRAVLGISEGLENLPFIDLANVRNIPYIVGDEKDVLWRLILCGRAEGATDIFRVTTECPFIAWEMVEEAWERHVESDNDITVTDFMPEGVNFEIYTLESLERSHRKARDEERSEYCSAYPRRVPEEFQIGVISPSANLRRLDLRLTVDYPEDLVLCRNIWSALKEHGPRIPIGDIIEWLDTHPTEASIVSEFVDRSPLWAHVVGDLDGG